MKRFSRTSRRAFLGGAGALLALPLFESLLGPGAKADDSTPRRLLAFYVPNGMHMKAWTPAQQGADFALTPILSPLEKVRKKLLVLSGIANEPSKPEVVGDHASGTGGFLTCRHVVKTDGPGIKNGISMDQVAALELGKHTKIASLQLGVEGGTSVGDCDSGYSCAYTRNISWASETQPLPKTVSPAVVFDLLFGGLDPEATAQEKERRRKYRTSVLDYVLDEAKSLDQRLGSTDRKKLDQYMTGVSELEKRIAQEGTGLVCTPGGKPAGNLAFPDQVKAMCDLMVLAFQCDLTRVISFMLGNAGSGRSYDFLGVTGAHHEISHHQDQQSNFDKLQTIDTWEVAQLAYLLEKMDAVEENGGTLLDHAAVFFSSEIEDGNSHSHYNLPVILAGGCGGAFKPGRHVVYGGSPPMANLFISMLNAVGAPVTTFGDNGTGPLDQLG